MSTRDRARSKRPSQLIVWREVYLLCGILLDEAGAAYLTLMVLRLP